MRPRAAWVLRALEEEMEACGREDERKVQAKHASYNGFILDPWFKGTVGQSGAPP